MDTRRIVSNAAALTAAVVDRGLTATQAAREANICPDTFFPLIRHDKPVSLKTAGKLRATFGDAVIRIFTAQG